MWLVTKISLKYHISLHDLISSSLLPLPISLILPLPQKCLDLAEHIPEKLHFS